MHPRFLFLGIAVLAFMSSGANAYKFDAPGGVCPKDPKIQCAVKCDDGSVADYMKWTGAGWSDLIGKVKDPDMNGEAKKLIDKANKENALLHAPANCK